MMYMEDGIGMDTVFGDAAAQQSGLFSKLVGAGKRLITGASLFTTVYTHNGQGKKRVAFAVRPPAAGDWVLKASPQAATRFSGPFRAARTWLQVRPWSRSAGVRQRTDCRYPGA